jgi:hypothetical protein
MSIWKLVSNLKPSRFRENSLKVNYPHLFDNFREVPFLSHQERIFMNMCGGCLVKTLSFLSHSENSRGTKKIYRVLLRRIMEKMMVKIGAPGIKSFLRVIAKYSAAHSEELSPMICISQRMLHRIGLYPPRMSEKAWMFLLSQLPEPGNALQHLTDSNDGIVKSLFLCMKFRELVKRKNSIFCGLLRCESYRERRRLFYNSMRTKSFKELKESFDILVPVFKDEFSQGMNFHDIVERMIEYFFEIMNQTDHNTWKFLGEAFVEESCTNLEDLCSQFCQREDSDDESFFSFQFPFPRFHITDKSRASHMLRTLIPVHLFILPNPNTCDFFRRMTNRHYSEEWKSILASGLYWFISMIEQIQAGGADLDFVLNSVLCEQSSLDLELFLSGGSAEKDSSSLRNFWVVFETLRGKYACMRNVPFSKMFEVFLEVFNVPDFVRRLQDFCSGEFESIDVFRRNFKRFCDSIQVFDIHELVGGFFYPETYVKCRICRKKIRYGVRFKNMRKCERCCDKEGLNISEGSDDEFMTH